MGEFENRTRFLREVVRNSGCALVENWGARFSAFYTVPFRPDRTVCQWKTRAGDSRVQRDLIPYPWGLR